MHFQSDMIVWLMCYCQEVAPNALLDRFQMHCFLRQGWPLGPINVGATLRFLVLLPSSFSDSLAAADSRLPRMLPDTEDVALCKPALAGVCGGVLIGGTIGGPVFIAVANGTWPSVGVGLFVCDWGAPVVCIEVIVAMDD
jgi:hypothetical protein